MDPQYDWSSVRIYNKGMVLFLQGAGAVVAKFPLLIPNSMDISMDEFCSAVKTEKSNPTIEK